MSIITDVKTGWGLLDLYRNIKGGNMDFKTVAGWLKVFGYAVSGFCLLKGYLDTQTVLAITVVLSAGVKALEQIAPLTKTTVDDEVAAGLKETLDKNGLLK